MTAAVNAHYTPAHEGWIAVVDGPRAVLIEQGDDHGLADALLGALVAADPVSAVLELLMRGGLASMPEFGYASVEPTGTRVLVRGRVSAELADTVHRGADYATWGEHRLLDADRVTLSVQTDGASAQLPLGRGAAIASSLRLVREPGTAPVPPELPAAAAAPPTQPVVAPRPVPPPPVSTPSPAAPVTTPIVEPETVAPHERPSEQSRVPEQTMVEFTLADADPGYSHLFEETIVRPIEHAAMRDDESADDSVAPITSQPASPPPVVPAASPFEEHDGLTIVSGDLARLRAEAPASGQLVGAPPAASTPPAAGAQASPELRFSNGLVEKLAGAVVIGRSPSSGKVSAGRVPRLVTIDDDPDLSRSHLQVDLEGDAVVVTDLHSRNGTTVALPGRTAERLRGGTPTTVIDGTVIDLGGGLTIAVHQPGRPEA